MARATVMLCTECGYVYDPGAMGSIPLVDREGWECPGNDGTCTAGIDRYEIAEASPLDDADQDEDKDGDGASSNFDPAAQNKDLETKRVDKAIGDLAREYEDGEIVLRPDWQRYYVWSNKQASLLIESIFLKLPIPLIYLALESDGTYSVVDGQQRLTALIEFVRNKHVDPLKTGDLKLSGLEVLEDLDAKRFTDLTKQQQRFLKQAELSVIRINSKTDPDLKLKVFRRLNTGAVKLNSQELRNAAFRGPYNDLLKLLAKNPTFLKMLNTGGVQDLRMLDVELVLRFSAWLNRGWTAMTTKNLGAFLDEEMELGATYNQKKLKGIEQKLKNAVELTWQTFGPRAFRRYFPGADDHEDGDWEMRQPNKALYDVVMFGFTRRTKQQFWPHLPAVRESLVDLMAVDARFQDAITAGTTDPRRIEYRFRTWLDRIDEIVSDDPQQRTFSLALKQKLLDADPTCALCQQKIHDIDDAHVHHVEHYWRGGKTIPGNAALAHRYCNLVEGGGAPVAAPTSNALENDATANAGNPGASGTP
jgi:hypothetical protein